MKNNRRLRIVVIAVVVIGAIVAGAWYYMNAKATSTNALTASGTIEATSVRLSPEVSGMVTELLVEEGQSVTAGQVLAKINDANAQTLYDQTQAALQSAQENLNVAQSNYQLAVANASDEKRQAAISGAELEVTNARVAVKALYDDAALQAAQTEQEIAAIDKLRDKDTQYRDNLLAPAKQADIDAAWAQVLIAKDKLKKADKRLKKFPRSNSENVYRAYLIADQAEAQKRYDHVVEVYNNLVGKANEYNVNLANANVALDEARLQDAKNRLADLQKGPNPDDLARAEARLTAAEANLTAVEQDTRDEQLQVASDQIELAKAQIENYKAQLQNIELQLGKYIITAPSDGVVLSRAVELGEITGPGSVMFEIGPLQHLQLTVYLPEEQFGRVKPGDQANVTTDAYPGRIFTARVDRLADQAEFTPRNVQTVEGRRNTVFAIYLSMDNTDLALMPGMWADVNFDHSTSN